MIKTFEEFLEKAKQYKGEFEKGEVKLNSGVLTTLIMAGVMDDLTGKTPTLEERFSMAEECKQVLKSKSKLSSGKKEEWGVGDIRSELDRRQWLAQINPLYRFCIVDEFSEAMKSMEYQATGKPTVRFMKRGKAYHNGRDQPVVYDVIGDFNTLFGEDSLRVYSSRNNNRIPGVVAVVESCVKKAWGNDERGGKMLNFILNDGFTKQSATVWPTYGTRETFPAKFENASKHYKDKVCLLFGKVSMSTRGFRQFNISDIVLFPS